MLADRVPCIITCGGTE